ncbi:hypothetical protein ACET3Z_011261 [Daucus carota]
MVVKESCKKHTSFNTLGPCTFNHNPAQKSVAGKIKHIIVCPEKAVHPADTHDVQCEKLDSFPSWKLFGPFEHLGIWHLEEIFSTAVWLLMTTMILTDTWEERSPKPMACLDLVLYPSFQDSMRHELLITHGGVLKDIGLHLSLHTSLRNGCGQLKEKEKRKRREQCSVVFGSLASGCLTHPQPKLPPLLVSQVRFLSEFCIKVKKLEL